MKKKLIMALAMAFAIAVPLKADTETVGAYEWTYRINGDMAEIINYDGFSYSAAISPLPTGSVTIPSTLGGKPVTGIGENAFSQCGKMESVAMPDSVTSIGVNAFGSCTNLINVIMSVNVTNIGESAFEKCYKLTGVTIPYGVTIIKNCAFYDCSALRNVSIPESVTSIGDEAFFRCRVLSSLTIPNSVTNIGNDAFLGCNVKSISIPQCVCANYLQDTFPQGGNVTNVIISAGATQIGDEAFYGCSRLMSVTIPGSVTNIGECAFSGCSGLTRVVFEGDAPTVGVDAFDGINIDDCEVIISSSSSGWDDSVWNGFRKTYGCSVEFDANGGVCPVAKRVVLQGSAIGELPVPERTGYAFDGWYSDANEGDMIQADDVVNADMLVYAHWTPDQYLVTFDANGGEGGTCVLMDYGSVLAAPTVTRTGYMFSGWFPQVPETVPLGGATYTAHWTVNSWLVILDANGGSCETEYLTVECGAAIGALPVPVLKYHEFLGWFTAAEGGDRVDATTEVNGSFTLYAHWRNLFEGGWTLDQNGVWRSGLIGNKQSSTLTYTVQGAGTVSFWCKVSSEVDEEDGEVYDGLSFCVDGTNMTPGLIGGEIAWTNLSFDVEGSGAHTLTWRYEKDKGGFAGEDCAWLDAVVWTPNAPPDVIVDVDNGKSITVPGTWLAEHSALVDAAGGDAVAALLASAANGRLSVAECYVLGLEPEIATNDFMITSFPMKADGTPDFENIVFYPPKEKWNVQDARPVLKGAINLGGPWQNVLVLDDGGDLGETVQTEGFRFFKVDVEFQ